jgi:hypothetical protein
MELIHRLYANATFSSINMSHIKINSLENLASKQRIFRIVKEQHGSCSPCDQKIARSGSRQRPSNLDIAPVRSCRKIAAAELVEPAGIEPATSCLQSRRSPS